MFRRSAKPRTHDEPDMGDPYETLEALAGIMLGTVSQELGGMGETEEAFLPSSSEGCMETKWRGLPARELFLAAHEGRVQDLQQLLTQRKHRQRIHDFDNDKVPILCCYALAGNHDNENPWGVVDALVGAGYDVNLRSRSTKETALQIAVLYGHVKVVEALLHHGARVDLTDWGGKSPGTTARKKCNHNGNNNENCCKVLRLIQKAQEEQQNDTTLQTKAEDLRQRGNIAFRKGKFEKARDLYTQSLDVLEDHRAFSNRALCALKLGQQLLRKAPKNRYPRIIVDWGREATRDAGKALALEPSSAKAHYRYTLGHALARDFPRAKKGLREGLEACPGNKKFESVMSVFNQWGVPDHISNPYCDAAHEANARIDAGEDWRACPFCRSMTPLPLEEECIFCTMKTETDVTEAEIVAFLLDH